MTLEARVPVPIVLDYFEDFGGAEVHLKWTPPGSKNSSIVPASAFSDLTADYYSTIDLRVDREPKGTRPFAGNGVFDRVTDGRGGAQVDLMAPPRLCFENRDAHQQLLRRQSATADGVF